MPRPFELPERPALDEQRGQTFEHLVKLMQRLLAPDGCPWDREQTKHSLKPYVLEEACEVMDAIDSDDDAALSEELGDLLLQVVFHAELARAQRAFGPDDIVAGICEKLVRRHPHVFADTEVDGSEEVTRNWDAIKQSEKGERGLLDGVPRSLPALMRAQKLSDKAARVGFDWPDAKSSRAKVSEELAELDEALAQGERQAIVHELGDVFFALVNLARQYDIDAESALRQTSDKFCSRFDVVERQVKQQHGDWPRDERGKPGPGLQLEELDRYWDLAKQRERGQSSGGS